MALGPQPPITAKLVQVGGAPDRPWQLYLPQLDAFVRNPAIATASSLGVVEVDGTTITITAGGVISAVAVPDTDALTLLNTITASGSGTVLADTTSLTNAYPGYLIVLENLIPASGAICSMAVHSGGAFQAANYLSSCAGSLGAALAGPQTLTTGIILQPTSTNQQAAGPGISGALYITNPSQSASPKMVFGNVSGSTATPAVMAGTVAGYWNGGNGAVDGFEIGFGGATISSGVVKVYGMS